MSINSDLLANMDMLLAGMFQDQYAGAQDLEIKQQAFAKLLYEDLRSVYDSYIPNVHVLDADKVAREVVIGIIRKPDIVLSISDDSYIKDTQQTLLKNASKLRESIRNSIKSFHSEVSKNYNGTNPIEDLNDYMSKLLSKIEVLDNDSVMELGKKFNSKINSIFGKNSLIGLSATSIGIENRPNRYIFFQKAFNTSGKDTINKKITKGLIDSLNSLKLTYANVQKGISSITGTFVDFGHVGVVDEDKVFNINTPALTKIVYNVSNLSIQATKVGFKDVKKARDIFIKRTGHISQSIEVTKAFTDSSGILFTLGLTVTTDMPSDFNRRILGAKEKRISDRAVADRLNSSDLLRRGLVERMSSTFLGSNIQKVIQGRSSPSLLDFLIQRFENKLNNKPTSSFSQKKTKTKNTSVTYSKPKGTTNKVTAQNVKTLSIDESFNTVKASSGTSLSSLQRLLDAQLQDVISANMGNGTDKKVLNYRTGRLAASAKVERLSQSREGMITAFYTYMKNPYATFSEGGRQQYPRSRDPKLLISKSIKEIAATKAITRMRAVLV